MKKRFFAGIVIIFTILISFACEKRPFSYKNKYLGNWKFKYNTKVWQMGTATKIETGEFEGKVYYNKGDKKDIIRILFAPAWDQSYTIEKNGTLFVCSDMGQFLNENEVSMEYHSTPCTFGLGSGYDYTVTGSR